MKKLGIIGNPVSLSLSPAMHNAALKHLGLDQDYVYIPVCVAKNDLGKFIEDARRSFRGFNVTTPLKSLIIPYLDSISNEAIISDSVNTILIDHNSKLHGKSTDGFGLEMALEESFGFKPKSLLFIGCGGAAKAASVHFLNKGKIRLFFVNRTMKNVKEFVDKLKLKYPAAKIDFSALDDHGKINKFLEHDPILVQATSLGLNPGDKSPFPKSLFRKGMKVFDMIYNKKTTFQQEAMEQGCLVENGKLMLLYQGVQSFKLWTGHEAPVAIMKSAIMDV